MFDSYHTIDDQQKIYSTAPVFKCETQDSDPCSSINTARTGSGVRAITQKFENRIQFNNDHNIPNVDSGRFTPPLWKTSPTERSSDDQYSRHQPIDYKNLTAAEKTQAVANGQRELMEMIRNMPESSYELSLKDLVDHHYHPRSIEKSMAETKAEVEAEAEPENNTDGDDKEIVSYKRNDIKKSEKGVKKKIAANNINHTSSSCSNNSNIKKSERTAQIYRSVSLDSGGLLLKMGFPVLWGSGKKKKKSCCGDSVVGDEGSRKSVDKEYWWVKQRFSGSRDSENGGVSSSNSGSSGSSSSVRSIGAIRSIARHGRSWNPSCWSFLSKGKPEEKLK